MLYLALVFSKRTNIKSVVNFKIYNKSFLQLRNTQYLYSSYVLNLIIFYAVPKGFK